MSQILGIDEVGRGPWAGPLVVGAVILPRDKTGEYPDWVAELTDSKKLSKKKREILAETIQKKCPATGLGWVKAEEIDVFGLSKSLKLATRRALLEVKTKRPIFSEIIIDGTINFLQGTPLESRVTVLKKADLLIKEVSAASIIAKVARDNYMTTLEKTYPGYGFSAHVGYGTALHRQKIKELGICKEHRKSFRPIATMITDGETQLVTKNESAQAIRSTKQVGDHAESIVTEFLETRGHTIIARNYKTRFYEIDIVSARSDKIFFTEVKYRKTGSHGNPLEMITKEKLKQMTFAAKAFLENYPDLKGHYAPTLAAASVSGEEFHFDEWLIIEE